MLYDKDKETLQSPRGGNQWKMKETNENGAAGVIDTPKECPLYPYEAILLFF